MTAADRKPPIPGIRIRRPEPEHRRSHQPVRRNSRMDGDWVHQWYRPMTMREKNELVRAARAYDRAMKQPGEKRGPIGSIGLELLEELATLAAACRGRVFPTLSWMQSKLKRSRDTIVGCLRRLSDAGLVTWVRRIVPVDEREAWARGPQVKQTSNAYRLELPKRLRKFVRKAPPAADEAARKAEMRARIDGALREESADARQVKKAVQDAGVERALARGAAMKAAAAAATERESSRQAQTGQKDTSTRSEKGVRPVDGQAVD